VPINIVTAVARMPVASDPLTIRVPCGNELVASLPGVTIPDGRAMAQALMDKANAALAPLVPVFKITDALLAAYDMLKSVPSFDVPTLIEALEKLAGLVPFLTKIVPPLSAPLTILDFIDAFIAYLEGLVAALNQLVLAIQRIDQMKALASQYPSLTVVIEAEEYNVNVTMDALSKNGQAMNSVLRLVSAIMGLIGMDPLPSLSSLGSDPEAAVDLLESYLREIRRVRGLIPL
jgi:hypothetical protein